MLNASIKIIIGIPAINYFHTTGIPQHLIQSQPCNYYFNLSSKQVTDRKVFEGQILNLSVIDQSQKIISVDKTHHYMIKPFKQPLRP